MKKVIIGLIIFLVVIGIIIYAALVKIGEYMLNSMIDSELEQLLDTALIPDDSISDPFNEEEQLVEPLLEADSTKNPSKQPANDSDGETANKPSPSDAPISSQAPVAPQGPPQGPPASQAAPQTALPSTTPKPAQEPISVDTIAEIKDRVTNKDKARAATLVLSNLTSADIKILQGFLSGGLTPEETKKAKEIAYARFSDEDIKIVKELYRKYMVSGTN